LEKETLFSCKSKLQSLDIPCRHRGITSQSKKATFGFKFVDSMLSCKYFKIIKDKTEFMDKVTQIKGTHEWKEKMDEILGLVIKPPSQPEENIILFKNFECGNAKIIINVRVIEFDEADPEA